LLQSVLLQRLRWSTYWRLVFGSNRHANANSNVNSNVHTNRYSDIHAYTNSYSYAYGYSYRNGNSDSDCDFDRYGNGDCDCNGYINANTHIYSKTLPDSKRYPATKDSADSAAETLIPSDQ